MADRDPQLYSLSQLGDAFGLTRQTVAKRLKGVSSAGERAGHPVYRLADVHMFVAGIDEADRVSDPARMNPTQRLKHYDAEAARLKYEKQAGLLCVAQEVRETSAAVLKAIAEACQAYPDVAERDHGASSEVSELLVRHCDNLQRICITAIEDVYAERG